jgi:hypothetical protein
MEFSDFPVDERWRYESGVLTITLRRWTDFSATIEKLRAFPDYAKFVWRGQRRDEPLLSSFDRHDRFRGIGQKERDRFLTEHLDTFRVRLRRAFGKGISESTREDDLWATGQHYGLLTPLLDWTKCPFIAAYFAVREEGGSDQPGYHFVYGLHRQVKRLVLKVKRGEAAGKRTRFVEFPRVVSGNDVRLRAQKGLFTKALNGLDIKTNVVERFAAKRPGRIVLIEIKIPSRERKRCLTFLKEEKGIESGTMFPDYEDIATQCNSRLLDIGVAIMGSDLDGLLPK